MARVAVGTEKEGGFRITVNDKIMVHLAEYVRYQERPEVPRELTQQGIAEVVNARRSHVSLALSTLRERGMVEERTARVTDEVRRRKTYFLTAKGFQNAKRLSENLLARTIRIEEASGVKDVKIAELAQVLGEKYYLVDVLCCVNREGTLDLAQLTGQKVEAPAPKPPEPSTKRVPLAVAVCPWCNTRVAVSYDYDTPMMVVCGSCGNTFRTVLGVPIQAPTQAEVQTSVAPEKPQTAAKNPGLTPLAVGTALAGVSSLLLFVPLVGALACGLLFATIPVLFAAVLLLKNEEERALAVLAIALQIAFPFFIISENSAIIGVGLQLAGTFLLVDVNINLRVKSPGRRLALGDCFAVVAALAPIAHVYGIPVGAALLVASGALLALTLGKIELKKKRERDDVAVSAVVSGLGMVTYVHSVAGLGWDLYAMGRIALITVPLYAFAAFARPIAKKTRAEITAMLSIFLMSFALSIAVAPWLVGWTVDLSPYFLILGAGSLYLAMRIHRLDSVWPYVSVGAGMFIVALAAATVAMQWSQLTPLWLAAIALWAAVGVVLCWTRFASDVVDRLASLRAGGIAAAGAALVLVGGYMLLEGFGAEGAVEVVLGAPLIGYALLRSGAPWVPRLALSGVFMAAVALTWAAVVVTVL